VPPMKLRTLIADDSVLFRRVLSDTLGSLPEVEVIGAVGNGRLAVQRVRELKPDLLTLDMEMPEMDGLAVLDALKQNKEETAVIVVSALTLKGGQLTVQALEKGAFDFITKPDTHDAEQSREAILREVGPRVRALAHRLEIRRILRTKPVPAPTPVVAPVRSPGVGSLDGIAGRMSRLTGSNRPELVLIGVSTGGPNALGRVLPALPAGLGVPLLVVQHMPPVFTQSLATSLSAKCSFPVREGANGDLVQPDVAYLAPGGRQMRLQSGHEGAKVLQITDDPPENNCRPAVDYLFRSVAQQCPGRSMAVILTGMGSDGTLGLRLLKRHGCFSIAQDERSCVVYGMPKAAVDAGVVDVVLPLDEIAPRIVAAVRGGGC